MTAKYDSADNPDSRGGPIKKGARIFFYPSTRAAYVGAAAEKAAADFEAARNDEAFYNGE